MTSPRIVRRTEKKLSSWVTLVEKEVEFASGEAPKVYHSLKQADYMGVMVVTQSRRIPIVRQFRSAIERYTWEFPGGLLEPNETAADCCRREVREEVGLDLVDVTYLGSHPAEVGRLENMHHMFFGTAGDPDSAFVAEPGMTVEYVTRSELDRLILDGSFTHPLHLALLALYDLTGSSRR